MLLLRLGYTSLWLLSFLHSHALWLAHSDEASFHIVSCPKERSTLVREVSEKQVLFSVAFEEPNPANNHTSDPGNQSFPLKFLWDVPSSSWDLDYGHVEVSFLCHAWIAELKTWWDNKYFKPLNVKLIFYTAVDN